MEPFVKLLTLFLLFQSAHQVPLSLSSNPSLEWRSLDGQHCAQRCRSDPQFIRYESGKSYFYRLQTSTALDGATGQPITLSASVVLNALNDCDLALQLVETRIEGVSHESAQSMQDELEATPLHFGYSDGHVTDVCSAPQDSDWSLNVKKAIVSAFQMTSPTLQKPITVVETDFQGACATQYQPISERFGNHVIQKRKSLQNCDSREEWISGLFPKQYSSLQSIPLVNGSLECIQNIQSDLIFGVTCHEEQSLRFGSQYPLRSELNLRFEKQMNEISNLKRNSLIRRHSKHLKMVRNDRNSDQKTVEEVSRDLCRYLEQKSEKRTLTQIFANLVKKLSQNEEEVKKVYQKIKNQEICQKRQLLDLYLDACAQSGSKSSIEVLKEWFESNDKNSMKAKLLFQTLSFVSEPEVKALSVLNQILAQNSDKSHVLFGISAYFHNLKHKNIETRDSEELLREEERAIEILVQKTTSGGERDQRIAIKALQNIGLERNSKAREQLVRIASQESTPEGVRVAALKALSEAMIGEKERPLVMKILENERLSNELRLNAYKSLVMSGSEKPEVQRIKKVIEKTGNENIKQFIRSHLKNLKETSDPHKKYVLKNINDVQFEEPKSQWFGVSNNFETSFMIDALGLGAVLETDVIYGQNSNLIPTSFVVNATLPLFGREVNMVELEIRQKGFENILQDKYQEIQRNIEENNSQKLIQTLTQTLYSLNTWQKSIHARNAFLEVNLKIDSKFIFSYNSRENQIQNEFLSLVKSLFSTDGALALQPINTRVHFPSSNGWPLIARINSTIVAQMAPQRANHVTFQPSIVWETEAGLHLQVKGENREVGVAFNIQSEPVWESIVDIDSQKSINWKVFVPKERISLFRTEAEVKTNTGNERSMFGSNQWQKCSDWTKKPFGIQFCVEKSSKKFEIFVQKSDQSLQSFELHASRDEKHVRIQFNTPNSEVDRHLEAEFILENQSEEKSLKMGLRSPFWGRINGLVGIKTEEKEKYVKISVERDGKKDLDLDLGLDSVNRGQKREFRPRVRITWRGSELMSVGGSVSVSKGRKNGLMINLEGNQKQFLKGSLIREGERKSLDTRISSDLQIQLKNGLELKLNLFLDKSQKHLNSDLNLEYRVNAHARKESFKYSLKAQNLTTGAHVRKASLWTEVTSSQWPQYSTHVQWNALHKTGEHVENEFQLEWGRNRSEKFHVIQVTKTRGSHVENTLNVVLSPLRVDYELRANGVLNSDERSAEITGKDRTGSQSQNDFKANFRYKHVSQSPLHLTLEANLKTNGNEYSYQDDLTETENNRYKGVTSVQWGQTSGQKKMAKMEYNYDIKSAKNDLHHEMALLVTSPFSQPIKHSALLRMSRDDCEVKSKLLIGSHLSHNLETLLSKRGRNSLQWEGNQYWVRAHAHNYEVPQRAEIEVKTPGNRIIHKTEVEFIPKTSLKLNSETKQRNENIFSISSHLSRNIPSKVKINTKSIEGNFDFRSGSDEHLANLEINHLNDNWKHSSSLRAIGTIGTVGTVPKIRQIEIQSKTLSGNGNPLLTIDSNLRNGGNSYFQLELPVKKTSVSLESNGKKLKKVSVNFGQNFKHLTQYSEPEPEIRVFSSKQSDFRSGLPVYSVDYKGDKGFHQFSGNFGENYEISGEGRHWNQLGDRQPFISVNLKNKRQELEQKSKISYNNNENNYIFSSETRKNGQNLAEISGNINKNWNQNSEFNFKSPRVQTRALIQLNPSKSLKVQFNAPQTDHVTALHWQTPLEGASLDSKTTFDNHVTYALAGNHFPNRKSFLSVKTPSYDVSGHVEPFGDTPTAKVSVIGPKVSHVTEISANKERKEVRVESRSDRKSPSDENIYAFSGIYNHLNQEIPSNFGLKFKNTKINGKIQVFGTGNRFLTLNAEHPQYNHVTDLQYTPENHVIVKSRTSGPRGQNYATIDSKIPLNVLKGKSHVIFSTEGADANLELEPMRRSGKFEFRNNEWNHRTVVSPLEGVYNLESQTKRFNSNYFDLNSTLSPKKSLKIQFKTPNYSHSSQLTRAQHVLSLDARTDYQNKNLHKIQFNSAQNLDFEVPQMAVKSTWSPESAKIDLRQRIPFERHLLASIGFNRNNLNQFNIDVTLDQQKDQNQRFKVDFEARDQQNQHVHITRANYAGNELKLESHVSKEGVVYGPNTWSLSYSPKYRKELDSFELIVNHVINSEEKEMEDKVKYIEGGKEKLGFTLRSKVEEYNGLSDSAFVTSFESTSASNQDLNLKVSLRTRVQDLKGRKAQIMSELKANQGNGREYSVSFHLSRDSQQSDDVIRGEMVLETPSSGRNDLNFELNLKSNEIQFSAKNSEKKLLEIKTNFNSEFNSEKKVILFDLKSNIKDIPSVSVSLDYFRSKQLALRLDIDGQRKAEVSLSRTGNDFQTGNELIFSADSSYWPKVLAKSSLKKNSRELDFEVWLKIDSKEVLAVSAHALKGEQGIWTGSGKVSQNGAEMAEMALEETETGNSYLFSAKNRFFKPIFIRFSAKKSQKVLKISANLCQKENQEKCWDLKTTWKTRDSSLVPERVELALNGNGNSFEVKTSFLEDLLLEGSSLSSSTSLLGLSEGKVQKKRRNELNFDLNSNKMGFEWIYSERGRHQSEHALRVVFPNGKEMELKSDFSLISGLLRHKTEVKDVLKQKIIFESNLKGIKNENEFELNLELNSNEFKEKKSFYLKTNQNSNEIKTKIEINFSENPKNFITIRTEIERKPEINSQLKRRSLWNPTSGQLNSTFLFSIETKDKKQLDFTLRAHASTQSVGVSIINVNRRGRSQQLNLFVQSEPSSGNERRFNGFFSTNQKRYSVEGALTQQSLNFKLTNEKTGEKSDVRAALNGKCVTWETRGNSLEKKFDFCLNFDQKNDKSFELSFEETSSEGKVKHVSLNIEVDRREGKDLKIDLDWSPQWINNWINSYNQWINENNNLFNEFLNEFKEVFEEFDEKYQFLWKTSTKEVLIPVFSLLSDEFQDVFQELQHVFIPFERVIDFWREIQNYFQRISQKMNFSLNFQTFENYWRPLARNMRKECNKMEICYKLVYGLEKYGFDSIIDYIEWNSIRLLKESHRLVVSTSGKVFYSLPVPEWIQYYRQSVGEAIQSIIESNETLKSIWDSINRLFFEISKDFDEINAKEVKNSLKELFEILFSASAQRVVSYDANRGRLSLEINDSKVLKRSLREIQTKSMF